MMKVEVLDECGYKYALLGLSLSHDKRVEDMPSVALRLSSKNGGHNKFLESIAVWLDVTAPRFWWQQFDTYRIGATKQSQSTMHTILERWLTQDDFQGGIDSHTLSRLNDLIAQKDFDTIKRELPEGFLQRRIVCTNYKTLRHIIATRATHKLHEWHCFINMVLKDIQHPEFFSDIASKYTRLTLNDEYCHYPDTIPES